jgi:UDP-N-acetylmuramoyl-tripeptide--D-alanyl-D-alanine ligase
MFNGNAYAAQALEAGASYAIVDEAKFVTHKNMILVDDVLTTLQLLAKHHRLTLSIPFLAITGTNGKTTTKELVHAVLSSTYKTYTTRGNLNNHIGVPLTILSIKKDADMAVIEMGANHLLEIKSYCEYTLPTHGMITNCGKAHLEGFGGVEGVKKGKGELFDFLRDHHGAAFVNRDYDYLNDMSKGIPEIITYGSREGEVKGFVSKNDPYLQVTITAGAPVDKISTQLVGDYNLPNVLAAVAVGKYFKVPDEAIKAAIESYAPSNSRSQMVEKNSNRIILDAYNANPSSMRSAIENFAALEAPDKILVLGAMAELGEDSLKEHEALIQLISGYSWKEVVLVGGDFLKVPHPFIAFKNSTEAGEWFRRQQLKNAHLLIKGSRSMQMERILE